MKQKESFLINVIYNSNVTKYYLKKMEHRNNIIFLGGMGIFISVFLMACGIAGFLDYHDIPAMIIYISIFGTIFIISLTVIIYQIRMKYKESTPGYNANPVEENTPLFE